VFGTVEIFEAVGVASKGGDLGLLEGWADV